MSGEIRSDRKGNDEQSMAMSIALRGAICNLLIGGHKGRSGIDLHQSRTQFGRKSCFGMQPLPATP